MGVLDGLKPERVFYYFEELTKIPRCSHHEEKVSNYLKSVGEKLGLETIQDDHLNIIIRKPATKGYENSVGVVLQGHMDMVCEKESDSPHDFSKDPIELIVDGDWIKANKTTLGADDGLGVAMGLALMEIDTLEHPEMELLVTVSEEVDMDGAINLSDKVLKGRRYINLDSEEEGILTMGSAGGETIEVELPLNYENSDEYTKYMVKVAGLVGGHSGIEIHKPKGNSNKVLNQVLDEISKISDLRIIEIHGGTKDNAIPRETEAKIGIKKSDVEEVEQSLDKIKSTVLELNKGIEGNITIAVTKLEEANKVLTKENTVAIINLIRDIPTGVFTMIPDNIKIVESSDNLARIDTKDDKFIMIISMRSSSQKSMDDLRNKIVPVIEKNGANYKIVNQYPKWEYKPKSELRDTAVEVFKKMYGKDMETTVIHAGLECGVINEKYPDMDIISIGSDLEKVHTPEERASISSAQRVYEYLCELIKELK